ncbi:hypothetical protein EDB81DRAFT_829607 [Dactylonectria macrodidyma]|uniref:Uncharacterized protein n=1 Tax=Dactylonectria macrodidyma TaxID=307937 RepID=A0A9P9D363_9HYPO|nr:hypothetical protein EDB81DRAFT_829607 [Dactylonectria macrodidyma]
MSQISTSHETHREIEKSIFDTLTNKSATVSVLQASLTISEGEILSCLRGSMLFTPAGGGWKLRECAQRLGRDNHEESCIQCRLGEHSTPWCGFEVLQLVYINQSGAPPQISLPGSSLAQRSEIARARKWKRVPLLDNSICPNTKCSSKFKSIGLLRVHLESTEKCLWSWTRVYAVMAILALQIEPISIPEIRQQLTEIFDFTPNKWNMSKMLEKKAFIDNKAGKWFLQKSTREMLRSATVMPKDYKIDTVDQSQINPKPPSASPSPPANSTHPIGSRAALSHDATHRSSQGEWLNQLTPSQAPSGRLAKLTEATNQNELVVEDSIGGQATKKRKVQRTDGTASAEKDHFRPEETESRNTSTEVIGNAEPDRTRYWDPVRASFC